MIDDPGALCPPGEHTLITTTRGTVLCEDCGWVEREATENGVTVGALMDALNMCGLTTLADLFADQDRSDTVTALSMGDRLWLITSPDSPIVPLIPPGSQDGAS